MFAMSVNNFWQSGQPWVVAVWMSSSVLLSKVLVQLVHPWGMPMVNSDEVWLGWMCFVWRERCDLLVNVLEHVVQVGVWGGCMLPGRESLIQVTGDVRRGMPKWRW